MSYSAVLLCVLCMQITVRCEMLSDDTSDPMTNKSDLKHRNEPNAFTPSETSQPYNPPTKLNVFEVLNSQCDASTPEMYHSPQTVTKHTNVDHCDEYKQQLTKCNHDSSTQHHSYRTLQQRHNHTTHQLVECNHTLRALQVLNDRYIYGQLDAQLDSLQKEKEALQINNKQQSESNVQLNRLNAVYEERQKTDKQTIERQQRTIQSHTDEIRQQSKQMEQLRIDNAQYRERQQGCEELQRNYGILMKSYSLHENARLQGNVERLNTTLEQCSISLRDAKVESGGLKHELGECNVEWGSCDQQYAQAKKAITELQSDIGQKKKKFTLCNKVSKDCKKERKEIKSDLKATQKEFMECRERMNGSEEDVLKRHCWVRLEDKRYIYIGSALCVFVTGVMVLIIWVVVSDVLKAQEEDSVANMEGLQQQLQETQSENERLRERIKSIEKEYETKREETQLNAEKKVESNETGDGNSNQNDSNSNGSWAKIGSKSQQNK